jgi:O-antigen/teichoic acid export membrane protein
MIRRRRGRARAGELGGLAGDSFLTAIWQGSSSAAELAQIALITHVLGLREYGRFALVVALVTLVAQLFDVRVSTATTAFGARKLKDDTRSAAGIFQLSYGIDLTTGALGFLVVAALAPFAGPALVGDRGGTLVLVFALAVLASTLDNSSLAILRLLGRFRLIAILGVALEAGRIGLVAVAVFVFDDVLFVLGALLVAGAIAGAVYAVAAAVSFRRATGGVSLLRPALEEAREERRPMLRMVLHTSLVSYARVAQTQLPTLFLGAVAGATQAGVYKVAMAAAAAVGRLADPAYVAILPRLSRLWSDRRQAEIRKLVRQSSAVSVTVMAGVLALLIVFRGPVLELLGGGQARAGAAAVVLAATAQAVNGALFWNIPLLWAAGRAGVVTRIALGGTALQALALVALVPPFEATGAAVAFLLTQLLANAAATGAAAHALRRRGPVAAKPRASVFEAPP